MKQQSIEVAVFPVAGIGSRFLPITKAGPKEMLPIVDKPLIQYVVEEALSTGSIKELVLITSNNKRAIEDYFDTHYELESRLAQQGKDQALATVKNILPPNVRFTYVRQAHPRGLGDAVLCAQHVVGNRPFAVLLADDIIDSGNNNSCLQEMVKLFEKTQSSIVAVEEIALADSHRYGIVSLAQHANIIETIVEKPDPSTAPSNLAITGRYIFTPSIFNYLATTPKGIGDEIQLTDAIATLLKSETVTAFPFNGHRYDCGSPVGLLKATIDYALKRPELRSDLEQHLIKVINNGNKSTN